MNGFTAEDGDYIPGYFYFYLNYYPIDRVVMVDVTKNGKLEKAPEKKRDFPSFYDYDRWFFELVSHAETIGRHMAVVKSRRKGYSYKVSSMLVRNYYFYKNSKGFALAAEAEFLVRDGILSKAWDSMDFIDQNTAWYKKRQRANTKMHRRASFIQKDDTGVETEMGYKSEIFGVTLKNDPDKARGKGGKLIVFEEAGSFPNLLHAWQVSRPSVEQGSYVFGMMCAFGTGGDMGEGLESLKELFERPTAYGCLELENIWDDEMIGQKCGFFIPYYANLEGTYLNKEDPNDPYNGLPFMDEDGNTNVRVAKKYMMLERMIVAKNSSDKRAIDRHTSEFPATPGEALMDFTANIFPKVELQKHLATIRNNKAVSNYKTVGDLYFDNTGTVRFQPELDILKQRDITKYKLDPGDDPTGQIVIWEHPKKSPPWGLYIAGLDPYDHDKSGTNSLGSLWIYKRIQEFDEYYELPVAEYTGRPNTANEYYENVRKLLLYFNATLMYENEKKGLFFYFERMNCTHLLADQPNDLIGDIIKDSTVNRKKGIHMNQSIKDWGEGAIRDWLLEEYAPGKKNLTKILSPGLLEELIFYNDKGNFDRVMGFMCVMIYREQLHKVKVNNKRRMNKSSRQLFSTELFGHNEESHYNSMLDEMVMKPGELSAKSFFK
jgi:hypothetical protein